VGVIINAMVMSVIVVQQEYVGVRYKKMKIKCAGRYAGEEVLFISFSSHNKYIPHWLGIQSHVDDNI